MECITITGLAQVLSGLWAHPFSLDVYWGWWGVIMILCLLLNSLARLGRHIVETKVSRRLNKCG
jgi:hypothetical protein